MARQSRRKREAARFGEANLLADMLAECQWSPPSWCRDKPQVYKAKYEALTSGIMDGLATAKVVDASNVAEYLFATCPKGRFDGSDFQCCSLPWPCMWIEAARPSCVNVRGNLTSAEGFPERMGWLLHSIPIEGAAGFGLSVDEDTAQLVAGESVVYHGAGLVSAFLSCAWTVDKAGKMREEFPVAFIFAGGEIGDDLHAAQQNIPCTLYWALMGLAFMHCRNVEVRAVDADHRVNRDRAKHGRKPFFRHHVVDINPMCRVLEGEGGASSNGLKKALHICRGHFARYTEDKPLFGHTTGLVWRPAHVRGDHKQGVVSSTHRIAPIEA